MDYNPKPIGSGIVDALYSPGMLSRIRQWLADRTQDATMPAMIRAEGQAQVGRPLPYSGMTPEERDWDEYAKDFRTRQMWEELFRRGGMLQPAPNRYPSIIGVRG